MEISDKDERFQTSDAESWDGFFRARDGANVPEEFMLDRGDELPQHRSELEEHLVPDWLRESWESSRKASLDQLSMDEIDAEIAAERKARRGSDL
jgi:hypothetical protein